MTRAIQQWIRELVKELRELRARLRATPRPILLLRAFGCLWNTVAGMVWVVLLSRSGWMFFKPVAVIVLPLQKWLMPWEEFWRQLDAVFLLGILLVPLVVLLFAPGLGALMLATWLEDRQRTELSGGEPRPIEVRGTDPAEEGRCPFVERQRRARTCTD